MCYAFSGERGLNSGLIAKLSPLSISVSSRPKPAVRDWSRGSPAVLCWGGGSVLQLVCCEYESPEYCRSVLLGWAVKGRGLVYLEMNLFCFVFFGHNYVSVSHSCCTSQDMLMPASKPRVHSIGNCSFQRISCIVLILFSSNCHKPAVLCTLHCTQCSDVCNNVLTVKLHSRHVTSRMNITSILFCGS